MATREMVCVGMCNPDYQWVEGQVAAYRRTEPTGDGLVLPVPDHLAALLRRRRHTRHMRLLGDTWMCLTCGQQRTG